MDAFHENDFSEGWGLGGEYSKIQRSIVENLFRPGEKSIRTVCPECCSNHERKAGMIDLRILGEKEEEEELRYISENYPFALVDALDKLAASDLKMNENGVIQ